MDREISTEIVAALSEIILETMPDAALIEKYGGIIVERIAGQAKTQCCGYFIYKNHISLEFTRGFLLEDAGRLLEGNGKQRRHVKLANLREIESKQCRGFLDQVAKL